MSWVKTSYSDLVAAAGIKSMNVVITTSNSSKDILFYGYGKIGNDSVDKSYVIRVHKNQTPPTVSYDLVTGVDISTLRNNDGSFATAYSDSEKIGYFIKFVGTPDNNIFIVNLDVHDYIFYDISFFGSCLTRLSIKGDDYLYVSNASNLSDKDNILFFGETSYNVINSGTFNPILSSIAFYKNVGSLYYVVGTDYNGYYYTGYLSIPQNFENLQIFWDTQALVSDFWTVSPPTLTKCYINSSDSDPTEENLYVIIYGVDTSTNILYGVEYLHNKTSFVENIEVVYNTSFVLGFLGFSAQPPLPDIGLILIEDPQATNPFSDIISTSSNIQNMYITELDKDDPQIFLLTISSYNNPPLVFTYTNTSVCFLSNCDVLLSSGQYKNITELELTDKVYGVFSKSEQKIKKLLKANHAQKHLTETNKPFLIRQSSFGENIPNKDIYLSGHHRILAHYDEDRYIGVQTFKLDTPQKDLRDLETVSYYHIVLENPMEGILVNGLAVESCPDENIC